MKLSLRKKETEKDFLETCENNFRRINFKLSLNQAILRWWLRLDGRISLIIY